MLFRLNQKPFRLTIKLQNIQKLTNTHVNDNILPNVGNTGLGSCSARGQHVWGMAGPVPLFGQLEEYISYLICVSFYFVEMRVVIATNTF